MKSLLIGASIFAIYCGMVAVPGEWFWFDPTVPTISDSHIGEDPAVTYVRQIKTEALIKYSVVLRTADESEPACVDTGGPYTYKPSRSGLLTDMTLTKWTTDGRCWNLPEGTYYGEVTWTILNPYGDLLPKWLQPYFSNLALIIPPKYIKRDVPVFKRLPKETD